MSAAAHALSPKPGWPDLRARGFEWHRSPLALVLRRKELVPTYLERSVCDLIGAAATILDTDWPKLSMEWMAETLGCDTRSIREVLGATADQPKAGLVGRRIILRRRAGLHYEYRLNTEELWTIPAAEAPKPQLVEKPSAIPPTASVSFYGIPVKRYYGGELVIAPGKGSATVSRCGECETVGIFEMIPRTELEIGEETAKPEPQLRLEQKAKVTTNSVRPARATPGRKGRERRLPPSDAPAGRGKDPERLTAIRRAMAGWKTQFHGAGPPDRDVDKVAAALGPDVPVCAWFQWMSQQKQDRIRTARWYSFFAKLAAEFRVLWERENGIPCPCGKTMLKPGVMCAHCGPQAKAPAPKLRIDQAPWEAVKRHLAERLPVRVYGNWVKPTKLISNGDSRLRVQIDQPTRDWYDLDPELIGIIDAAVEAVHGEGYEVDFVVE